MIQFANPHTRPAVRNIWKEVFGDDDVYMDLYFAEKYEDENTLVAVEDNNKVVASLQMLPYEITFYGSKIPFYYLAGLSTLPDYRGRGLMAQLILKSHELMLQRHIPLSILVPAERSLFAYYARFGYAQTFRKNYIGFEFSVKEIWKNSRDENEAYQIFDKTYNQHDFCVQKSFSDFKTIIQQENNEDFQPKLNLSGLARIIDPELLLHLYAKKHPENKFLVELQDIQFGRKLISVENGSSKLIYGNFPPDFKVDEKLLVQLLFGFRTHFMTDPFRSLFPNHNPIMNYMLE
jgi:predicted acetyltransferase